MRVKLIQMTENPIDVMWTAARTCYASESPIDMWDKAYETYIDPDNVLTDACEKQEKAHWKLVQKVLNSGHQSIAEHVYFTFAIEGISRACSHQLVRHRAGIVFSQQSQRYCVPKNIEELEQFLTYYIKGQYALIKETGLDIKILGQELSEEFPGTSCEVFIKHLIEKYFTHTDSIPGLEKDDNTLVCSYLNDSYFKSFYDYLHLLAFGLKGEDARNVLPNATKTNITMSVNYRELIHLCNLRLCTRAQKEIRDLFKLIVKEVKNVDEKLASYLVPQCEVLGLCTEHRCCGRKPRLQDVMNVYNSEKENTISSEAMKNILNPNPQVNDKLKIFMEQKNILN